MGRVKKARKSDWIEAALLLLQREGVEAVRVEALARRLRVSKSGFYWHFKDRRDLLTQLVDYWAHEYTGVAADNQELQTLGDRGLGGREHRRERRGLNRTGSSFPDCGADSCQGHRVTFRGFPIATYAVEEGLRSKREEGA